MTRDVNGYVPCTTGVNVRATVNVADPTNRIGAQAVLVQAKPGNTAAIYIGLASMDISTGVGVLGVIPAHADPTTGPFPSWTASQPNQMAGLNVADYYVQGTTGDGVIVSYTQG